MKTIDNARLLADSGGSKTRWLLTDAAGNPIAECRTRGMAALHPGSPNLKNVARAASEMLKIAPGRVVLSLGGLNTEEVEQALREVFPAAAVAVFREAQGVHFRSGLRKLGCSGAVLAGTGITAFGFFHDGEVKYADGWGPVFGDAGSGGGIGAAAIRLTLSGIDGLADAGRVPELFAALARNLEIASFAGRMEFKRRINLLTRREIAALAPEVMALARAGDAAARNIVGNAARAIAAAGAAVAEQGSSILLTGGLFGPGGDFVRQCEAALAQRRKDCRFVFHAEIDPLQLLKLSLTEENI